MNKKIETEITNTAQIIKELETISKTEKPLSIDEISNILIGLKTLYEIKFDTLFETFTSERTLNNELEQGILNTWNIIDDIQLIAEGLIEEQININDALTAIEATAILYNLRFKKIHAINLKNT